ncbi:hypothetical protein [uncultured Methanobrevibacter sp.]|uniref:hypothetical protein n=1 Tax=uncultured Methanobrevibacter sp. TaxID=253161 RepID=UPI0025F3A61C|nr:hypothetical protein [uncultured Methanobrevibacter sp.]
MSWVNVGNIKGDTGETGDDGFSPYITVDRAHGFIVFGDEDSEQTVYFSDLKGPKGDTGATGPAGPVNVTSTLDTADNTNVVVNSAIATAIQNVNNQIGTITAAQSANLTLLGS